MEKPPFLSGLDPDSFAAFTIRERLPKIAERVQLAGTWSSDTTRSLQALIQSLPDGGPPQDLGASSQDANVWEEFREEWQGHTWLTLPFLMAEFAFYRAILDAVGYSHSPELDPFAPDKEMGARQARVRFLDLATRLRKLSWNEHDFHEAMRLSAFGNSADLSQVQPGNLDREQVLIVDDVKACFDALGPPQEAVIDVFLDNAGEELTGDLLMLTYLLQSGVSRVRVHVKPSPIFVSDATLEDFRAAVSELAQHENSIVSAWGNTLKIEMNEGHLELLTDPFWCQAKVFAEMPPSLIARVSDSSLIIQKGDLNYRRYVEDRAWPFDSPTTAHRLPHLPPVLALRVLKSELLVGLPSERIPETASRGTAWMTEGTHGVMQYFSYPTEPKLKVFSREGAQA